MASIGTIDNSISDEMRQVITWQYDNAPRLIGMVSMIETLFKSAVEIPWNLYLINIFNITLANTFGLSVWGTNLGIRRPTWISDGVTLPISDEYYKRLLHAHMYLTASSYSMHDIEEFLKIAYGNRVEVKDCNDGDGITDSTLSFSASSSDISDEEAYLLANSQDVSLCHAGGIGVSFLST